MRLFEVTENNEIRLNKVWIFLIPELKELITRDKGSAGDADGRKKLQAHKEFTYIYFNYDFSSPIRNWEPQKKHKEALHYARLESIDDKVKAAGAVYWKLMLEGSRSLKTYKALLTMLDRMDAYYENINFDDKDKKGELLHQPDKVVNSTIKLNQMHSAVEDFATRVEAELAQTTSIQGEKTLGDQEGKKRPDWDEQNIAEGSKHEMGRTTISSPTFASLISEMRGLKEVKKDLVPTDDDDTIAFGED